MLVGLCWGRVLGLCGLLGLFCGAGLGVGARGVRVLAAAGAGARWWRLWGAGVAGVQ